MFMPGKNPLLANDARSGEICPPGMPRAGICVPGGSSPTIWIPLAPSIGLIIPLPSCSSTVSESEGRPPIMISSCPTASRMRHANRGCRIDHQIRRAMNVEAMVKLTTSQTTPRTASQFTSAMTTIQYHCSCCPASSMKVSTAATVRLGSRSGLMKSRMRHSHRLPVVSSKVVRSSRCCWASRVCSSDRCLPIGCTPSS